MKMSAIQEVYEEFRHLDLILGDMAYCNEGGHGIYIASKLWVAIKKDLEKT
jgi:hypothetical protein